MGFYSSVGDHRGIIFDMSARSLLGRYKIRVVRADCKRLISKNAGSVSKYNEVFEEQVRPHKLKERLDELEIDIGEEGKLTEEQIQRFKTIHKQTKEVQLHAKRKCRRIIKPNLDFSDKVAFWYE